MGKLQLDLDIEAIETDQQNALNALNSIPRVSVTKEEAFGKQVRNLQGISKMTGNGLDSAIPFEDLRLE